MKKVVTVIGKNGVEYTVALTAEEANYYLQLAQAFASSVDDVMKKFSEFIISKSQHDAQPHKDQYN